MTTLCGPGRPAPQAGADGQASCRPSAVPLDAGLRQALAIVARAPQLLVACDYDGTLAPITSDLSSVRPLPEAASALRSLALLPATTTAVISGRALRELAAMSRLPSEVHLVGSHGSEFDIGFAHLSGGERAHAARQAGQRAAKDRQRATGGGAGGQARQRHGARARVFPVVVMVWS